ncbi:MAG: hypothetical protein CVU89_07835 [Firmicutes bacterium HGW-Firmicutes-14]|nr:MAG: hypothetical protein CVU89_07835 [Firmicutes bacterium HGW-Firmicutes-14]
MQTSRHETELKVRVKRKPTGVLRKLILLIIIIYIGLAAYRFIHDLVITRLAEVEKIQRGVIQTTIPAEAILIRNERALNAPGSGRLKVIVPEGERVRVGQVVAQVVSPSIESSTGEILLNISAPMAGVVSYRLDGLEEIYTPGNVHELDLEKVISFPSDTRQILAGSRVEGGEPVARIVNNLDPLYIFGEVSGDIGTGIKENDSLSISFNNDDKDLYRATLVKKNLREKSGRILLSIPYYEKELVTARRTKFWIVTDRHEGYYVPAQAIVKKDGTDGIYTVYKEQVKWKQVEIIARIGENVAVSGVTPDIKVILNPEYVKEGFPLRNP